MQYYKMKIVFSVWVFRKSLGNCTQIVNTVTLSTQNLRNARFHLLCNLNSDA